MSTVNLFSFIYLFSEYHLHQTVNQMSGHVCVAGDRATVNEQMPSQRYKLCLVIFLSLWPSYLVTCSCFVVIVFFLFVCRQFQCS